MTTAPAADTARSPQELVSVNLCCYNGEAFLEETLESIAGQTHTRWELVAVNDGSSDGTQAIIDRFAARGFPVTRHQQANQGLGASRNTALSLSRGAFIAFIDQDDIWLPDKLARQLPLFADPGVGLVFSDSLFFNADGRRRRLYERTPRWTGYCFSRLLTDYFLSLETVVIRREALAGLTYWFNPSFRMIEEADLFCRIAHRWQLACVDAPLSKWRVHPGSQTWRHYHRFANELEKMVAEYHRVIPDFATRYAREIETIKRRIGIDRAFHQWSSGQGAAARRTLRGIRDRTLRIRAMTALTLLPARPLAPLLDRYRRYRMQL